MPVEYDDKKTPEVPLRRSTSPISEEEVTTPTRSSTTPSAAINQPESAAVTDFAEGKTQITENEAPTAATPDVTATSSVAVTPDVATTPSVAATSEAEKNLQSLCDDLVADSVSCVIQMWKRKRDDFQSTTPVPAAITAAAEESDASSEESDDTVGAEDTGLKQVEAADEVCLAPVTSEAVSLLLSDCLLLSFSCFVIFSCCFSPTL